ncbi:aspartic peptidase domain-containing protein [Cerioporus squamosus]|nr:aspartic peptidase domain-containing protein [Cerioporus squamosus]
MLAHHLLPLSFLSLSLTGVHGSPVRQASSPLRVKIRSPSMRFHRRGADPQAQDHIFDPYHALQELEDIVFKYQRATQFLQGVDVNAGTRPDAGYPPFEANDTQNTPQLQTQAAASVQALSDSSGGPSDMFGGVPPVGSEMTTMPLTDYVSGSMDVLYEGQVALGSPAQYLDLQADTGSADLWVPSNCKGCLNDGFKAQESSTYMSMSSKCTLTYGSGSASGVVAQDTVSIGTLTVPEQGLCAVRKVSTEFNDQPTSGILGLAFGTIAVTKKPTFFENLLSQKKVPNSFFAIYLTRGKPDGSEICFGCYDPTKATGPITWILLVARNYWSVRLDGASVGRSKVARNAIAAIDSGATLIHLPADLTNAVYDLIPGSNTTARYGGEFHSYPCNATINIVLWLGGRPYAIHPADLNLGKMDTDPTCVHHPSTRGDMLTSVDTGCA